MLTQRMSKEFFMIARGVQPDENRKALQASVDLFDDSLTALTYGGGALPGVPSNTVFHQLNRVKGMWMWFKAVLESHAGDPTDDAINEIYLRNLPLLAESNVAVQLLKQAGTDQTLVQLDKLADPGVVDTTVSLVGIRTDISGRQRMLSQRMSKEALLVSLHVDSQNNRDAVAATVALFSESDKDLMDGNMDLGMKATTEANILHQMHVVHEIWKGFSALMTDIASGVEPSDLTLRTIYEDSPVLLAEMNKAVQMFAAAEASEEHRYFNIPWTYNKQDDWPPRCRLRHSRQSPIDIVSGRVVPAQGQTFLRFWRPRTLATPKTMMFNSGTGVRVHAAWLGWTMVSSALKGLYHLHHFAFRTPSEHTFDGERAPLELQAVFRPADGSAWEPNVTISFLYYQGEGNATDPFISSVIHPENLKVFRAAPTTPHEVPAAEGIRALLNNFRSAVYYQGSETMPPCDETMHWMLAKPQTLGLASLAPLLELVSVADGLDAGGSPGSTNPPVYIGNARSIQGLNGRLLRSMRFHQTD
eukprot:TRINITY_DN1722_c0_g1_i3.p1 TRINITY_DN1722_c0_g1~~TRINITY_DN1722_c0_g1_i3.p1  ORF type:complete len:530 (+),score=114.85 TRINITY_DN1722_c0_g1_i3:308-1897(+)